MTRQRKLYHKTTSDVEIWYSFLRSVVPAIHGPEPAQRRGHQAPAVARVVVGKLERVPAGPAQAGAVHKVVGGVGNADYGVPPFMIPWVGSIHS